MASLYGDMIFNIDHGYLEGLVRGFRSGILTRTDYLNLIQCETLEGKGFYYTIGKFFFTISKYSSRTSFVFCLRMSRKIQQFWKMG